MICQEKNIDLHKSSLNTQASGDKSEPYSSFLNNVNTFRALDTLPVTLNIGKHISVADLVQNGTNLAMQNSVKRKWIELSKNETGMNL